MSRKDQLFCAAPSTSIRTTLDFGTSVIVALSIWALAPVVNSRSAPAIRANRTRDTKTTPFRFFVFLNIFSLRDSKLPALRRRHFQCRCGALTRVFGPTKLLHEFVNSVQPKSKIQIQPARHGRVSSGGNRLGRHGRNIPRPLCAGRESERAEIAQLRRECSQRLLDRVSPAELANPIVLAP